MLIDSHCHLNFPQFEGQHGDLLQSMRAHGVGGALTVCTTLEEFPRIANLVNEHPYLWCSVGVHPDNVDVEEPSAQTLVTLSRTPGVVAIGETGLDYFRTPAQDCDWQRDRFRQHIRAARATGLPLIIHTRSAPDDTLALLREEGAGQVQGVMHCFTESADFARKALDMGFLISFSGIISFRNAADLREVAAWVPADRVLVETDSPYLAPVPMRGKTNQPAWVSHVAQTVAQVRGVSIAELAAITTENFCRLFRVTAPPAPVASEGPMAAAAVT